MKNIFIVTDFSEASQNAGRYGVELAKYFRANVFLFHAYQAPVLVPESYVLYTTEDVGASAKELLKKEEAMINPGNLVNFEICCDEGIASNAIISEATKRKADVIVCGMKGMAKTFRKIFGSTTTTLTSKSSIPLIVVPDNAGFIPPKNIALASDMDPETSPATVELLKVLGDKFASKLSIVWVVEDGTDVGYEMRFQQAGFINQLKSLDPVFEFPSGNNITKALDAFVKNHTTDMLVMIPHKHDMLERFFTESITRKMIFHTHIPLLVLPQKKYEETGNEKKDAQTALSHG